MFLYNRPKINRTQIWCAPLSFSYTIKNISERKALTFDMRFLFRKIRLSADYMSILTNRLLNITFEGCLLGYISSLMVEILDSPVWIVKRGRRVKVAFVRWPLSSSRHLWVVKRNECRRKMQRIVVHWGWEVHGIGLRLGTAAKKTIWGRAI